MQVNAHNFGPKADFDLKTKENMLQTCVSYDSIVSPTEIGSEYGDSEISRDGRARFRDRMCPGVEVKK